MPAQPNTMLIHKWLRFHRLRAAVTMSTALRSDISKLITMHLRGFRGVPLTSAEMGTQFPMLAKVLTFSVIKCEWLSTRFACSYHIHCKIRQASGRRGPHAPPTQTAGGIAADKQEQKRGVLNPSQNYSKTSPVSGSIISSRCCSLLHFLDCKNSRMKTDPQSHKILCQSCR